MSNQYKGMRWLKCDLQMQTPADARHWLGERLVTGGEAEAAKAFSEACYQAGLDVVGITDHNFLSKDFLPYLQSAFDDIEREYGHKITLFPGFEFEADVGKGMHVICLFEPGTGVDDIDHILTECGVGRPRTDGDRLAKSVKRLPDILEVVQKPTADGSWQGIVIVPHVFEDSLFDNERINEWLQQEEYKNPNLLAVEVPKPVKYMSEGFQKLFRAGDDCHQDWKRIRPIATLMSSDSKRLIELDDEGRPTANSIGYRYSWIKMSEPSIESLRQAFLDHESRIILPDDVSTDVHPRERIHQARILSISIRDVAFLADQEAHFSPNLNCVIGGRGSGKSTLLEYLRLAFGKDKESDLDEGTEERIARIRDTLAESDAELEVFWESADGVKDRIVWEDGAPKVPDRELADPETFFSNLPIQFYSQQQLNRLTESEPGMGSARQAQRLLELIDGFARNELDALEDQERKLKMKLQDAFANRQRANALARDRKRLVQERQELDRQWKARTEIQDEADRHQKLKSESRYLETLLGMPGEQSTDVADFADRIAESHIPFQVEDAPHAAWFRQFDHKVKDAKDGLAKTIRKAVEQFNSAIEEFKTRDPEWPAIQAELDQADAKFSEACAEKGLTPDDVGRLQEISQLRADKRREIEAIDAQIQQLKESAGNPDELMQELHQIWREQFQKRQDAAQSANELAMFNEGGGRFIEVTAKYQREFKSFEAFWQDFSPKDGRTQLGRSWQELGERIYEQFLLDDQSDSPWETLRKMYGSEEGNLASEVFGDVAEKLKQHIIENVDQFERLMTERVQDAIDIKLFRADGSTAGSIAEGTLSDGQRNTAALALLLAQDGGPLVIDQPEDELDSNFVFRELIPMLRKVKSRRQLIMATHNANLPVNGDAELVYALEARNGKGEVLANGGLDQQVVTRAVLDVMEGTEEAFRRRREKYHF